MKQLEEEACKVLWRQAEWVIWRDTGGFSVRLNHCPHWMNTRPQAAVRYETVALHKQAVRLIHRILIHSLCSEDYSISKQAQWIISRSAVRDGRGEKINVIDLRGDSGRCAVAWLQLWTSQIKIKKKGLKDKMYTTARPNWSKTAIRVARTTATTVAAP